MATQQRQSSARKQRASGRENNSGNSGNRQGGQQDNTRRARSSSPQSGQRSGQRSGFMSPLFAMQQMMRVTEDFVRGWGYLPNAWMPPAGKILPKVHVWEDEDAFYLQTVVPAINPRDVEVSVNDNFMTISCGSEDMEENEEGHKAYRSQSLCRTIMLPENADAGEASAEMVGGALIITMPKRSGTAADGRRIPIRQAA